MHLLLKQIIREISNETGIPENKIKNSVEHVCNYTREQFIKYEDDISWETFGRFRRLYDEPKEKTKKEIKRRSNKPEEK